MSSYYLQIIRKSTKCLYSAGKKKMKQTLYFTYYTKVIPGGLQAQM